MKSCSRPSVETLNALRTRKAQYESWLLENFPNGSINESPYSHWANIAILGLITNLEEGSTKKDEARAMHTEYQDILIEIQRLNRTRDRQETDQVYAILYSTVATTYYQAEKAMAA